MGGKDTFPILSQHLSVGSVEKQEKWRYDFRPPEKFRGS